MGNVYACADFHGCQWAWDRIQEILEPEDTIYFLGDAIDRGDNGLGVMLELLHDNRVMYLKGNHEDMMIKFYSDNSRYSGDGTLWFSNGGYTTYEAMEAFFEMYPDLRDVILNTVRQLPLRADYTNTAGQIIHLSHAGCARPNATPSEYLWDRNDIYMAPEEIPENEIYVHGHTPIPYVREYVEIGYTEDVDDVFWYCGNRRCCIDCGTVWTDCVALLNLDTLESTILYKDDEVDLN